MRTFLSIDSHLWRAVFIILTSFYLNKNNILAINGNNINLFTIGTPITFQYHIAFIN